MSGLVAIPVFGFWQPRPLYAYDFFSPRLANHASRHSRELKRHHFWQLKEPKMLIMCLAVFVPWVMCQNLSVNTKWLILLCPLIGTKEGCCVQWWVQRICNHCDHLHPPKSQHFLPLSRVYQRLLPENLWEWEWSSPDVWPSQHWVRSAWVNWSCPNQQNHIGWLDG